MFVCMFVCMHALWQLREVDSLAIECSVLSVMYTRHGVCHMHRGG